MNKLICGLVMASALFGCAAFQGSPSKVDQVVAQGKCIAGVLKPYEKFFTLDDLKQVLAGTKSPVDVLEAVDVTPQEISKVVQDLKACKNPE